MQQKQRKLIMNTDLEINLNITEDIRINISLKASAVIDFISQIEMFLLHSSTIILFIKQQ